MFSHALFPHALFSHALFFSEAQILNKSASGRKRVAPSREPKSKEKCKKKKE